MPSNNDTQNQLVNLQAQQLAAQVAHWAAQLEFQKERLRLLELPEMQGKLQIEIDRLAWEKAEAEYERAFREAALTGTYNGEPTVEWLTQQAQLLGVLDGKQTLQGRLTDAQIQEMDRRFRLANDEFLVQTTGYYNGQKTFDREKWEAAQASDAWKFLATLTGPANAFKQARAIASMPGGMSDLMGAWAGRFGATPGSTAVGTGGRASFAGLLEGFGGDAAYQYPGTGGGTWGPPAAVPNPPAYPAPPPGTYVPPQPFTPPAPTGPPAVPGMPAPASPGSPGAPFPGTGNGTGFWVWLSNHGVTPGDPAVVNRIPEFIRNYQSLPPSVSSVGRIQRSSVGLTAKSGESQAMSLKASKC